MVGGSDTLDGNVLPAHALQLGDIVAEARQLDDETAAAPLHDEHLVGQRIVRLVGMEPRRAKSYTRTAPLPSSMASKSFFSMICSFPRMNFTVRF